MGIKPMFAALKAVSKSQNASNIFHENLANTPLPNTQQNTY